MSRDVEFQDITYTVSVSSSIIKESERKCVLRSVSGSFHNGQLCAIMGPSGAGKSSLLNAISGYQSTGVIGNIHSNRQNACYITQDDLHQPLLSVEELMRLSCALKLRTSTSHETVIDEILADLHLDHRRNIRAEHLSGGERKRLSVALELVANPSIFFLDEPTSGLDEVTAIQCISLLKRLASEKRTVVCTIHQPSATIFSKFDHIFVLARGECVYQGGPKYIVPFLAAKNLICPSHYNPSDYIIELCDSNDSCDIITVLSNSMQNGKLVVCGEDIEEGLLCAEPITSFRMKSAHYQMMLERKTKSSSGAILFRKMKAISKYIHGEQSISGLHQFFVLFAVMMLKILRNRTVLCIQFGHHILCGLTFGLIFLNAGNVGERMFDHLKFCIGIVIFIAYTQVMVPILSFPSEVKLVKKECFNRWYSLTPYYLALTFSRIPLQIVYNMLFVTIAYWMTGLPPQLWRFAMFAFVGILVSLVAEGMGLAIGSAFNVTNGSAVGPLLIAPFLGLAIYGFDFANEISIFMYALMKTSFVRVGVVALVLVVFGYDREQMHCDDIYCHFDDPKVLLRFLRIENVSLWHEIGFLLLLFVIFRTLLYLSLRKRCSS